MYEKRQAMPRPLVNTFDFTHKTEGFFVPMRYIISTDEA